MRTKVCPKFLIFVNAVFALAAIGLTAYKTPASFLDKQAFLPDNNVLNQTPVQEQLYNKPTPDISQCRSFRQRGGGWRHHGKGYGRMYNIKTVETIKGKVVSVDPFIPRRGM
ncbi:MAG: hypothetical protein WBF90_37255, partial [Rivularia sp. (in: cyanobacteria)]